MLKNLVALVTGSAQTLGKSTAEMFLRNGAKVILCDLPKSNGAEVAETLGSDVTFVPTDITSEDDVRNALAITQKTYGRLNVVVNCSNHLVYEQMIDKKKNHAKSLETITHSIKVNTIGTFNVIRLAVPLLYANEPDDDLQRGVIVNTVHSTAFDGNLGDIANAASNAAIVGMTQPIVREVSKIGIRVVNIAPAAMETEYYQRSKEVQEYYKGLNTFPQRLGKLSEFAQMVQTIVENPMLNMETIHMNCGHRTY